MKFALAISQINFMPKNYRELYHSLLLQKKESITHVIIIKNRDIKLLKQILSLLSVGAWRLGFQLLLNTMTSFLKFEAKIFLNYGAKIIYCNSINDKEVIEKLHHSDLDIILNLRTRCIFKDKILNLPKLGCFNLHHGLLPQDKGIFCDLWAIYNNRTPGITIHKMTNKIDQGAIVSQTKISAKKNYLKYLKSTIKYEVELISNFLLKIEKNGELPLMIENKSEHVHFFKSPKIKDIIKMQIYGIRL